MYRAQRLGGADAEMWRALRLEGLALHPDAFLTTLREADAMPLEEIAARLEAGHTFGVFAQACVGIASLIPQGRAQTRHRAEITAFYVQPAARGSGASDALMTALLDHARSLGCWQTELSVAETNDRARRFYARHGFEVAGRLPNAVLREGQTTDDVLCVRIDTDIKASVT